MKYRSLPRLVALLAPALVAGGCSATPLASPPAPALSVPTSAAARPIRDSLLSPGVRYRFDDLIPGQLAIEVTGPDPAVANSSDPALIYFGSDVDFTEEVVNVFAMQTMRVFTDTFPDLQQVNDLSKITAPLPDDLLGHVTRSPFVDLLTAARPITLSGRTGRAIDLRIKELPSAAEKCGRYGSFPPCIALFYTPPGGVQVLEAGERRRLIEFILPAGPVLIVQNLDLPAAEALVMTLNFVEP